MADDSAAKLLLIVTGSTLRAEEVDRPLAYYLRQRIEQSLAESDLDGGPFRIQVVADFRWIHDEPLHDAPTISLGGPGVNALAHRWLEEIPSRWPSMSNTTFRWIPTSTSPGSIWGMDNPSTQIAVSVFIERFLPRFLEHVRPAPRIPRISTTPTDRAAHLAHPIVCLTS